MQRRLRAVPKSGVGPPKALSVVQQASPRSPNHGNVFCLKVLDPRVLHFLHLRHQPLNFVLEVSLLPDMASFSSASQRTTPFQRLEVDVLVGAPGLDHRFPGPLVNSRKLRMRTTGLVRFEWCNGSSYSPGRARFWLISPVCCVYTPSFRVYLSLLFWRHHVSHGGRRRAQRRRTYISARQRGPIVKRIALPVRVVAIPSVPLLAYDSKMALLVRVDEEEADAATSVVELELLLPQIHEHPSPLL